MSTIEENKAIVKKMQAIVFRIMCDIDDFCRDNDIRYYLSGGTCLGALRHKGFIPWDDDGDLMMPRPDYERFLETFPKSCGDKYFVGSLKTDTKWQRPFSRICDKNSRITTKLFTEETMGVFVDIFPIDGLPNGKIRKLLHYRRIRVINALRNTSVRTAFRKQEGYRLIKNMAQLVTSRIGPRWFAERIDKVAAGYPFESSADVAAILAIHYWDKETIKRELMETSVSAVFEGREFPLPVGYEQYLRNLYGDYMKIPKDAEKNGYTHLDGWIIEFDT